MSKVVVSPVSGQAVSLDQVNDEMFSKRMLGDGAAVIPESREVRSPISGRVTMVYETQHAIGLETAEGYEILLHIGIDTVMLKGIPFDTHVEVGSAVEKGDLLTVVDWPYIHEKGCDPIVVLLAVSKQVTLLKENQKVASGDELFEIIA